MVTCLFNAPEDADLSGYDGPGWYWSDEVYHLHGPFGTKEEAEEIFRNYNLLK